MSQKIVGCEDPRKALRQAIHRLEEQQARDRVKERKKSTQRLIQEGAILEKAVPGAVLMDLKELDNALFRAAEKTKSTSGQ